MCANLGPGPRNWRSLLSGICQNAKAMQKNWRTTSTRQRSKGFSTASSRLLEDSSVLLSIYCTSYLKLCCLSCSWLFATLTNVEHMPLRPETKQREQKMHTQPVVSTPMPKAFVCWLQAMFTNYSATGNPRSIKEERITSWTEIHGQDILASWYLSFRAVVAVLICRNGEEHIKACWRVGVEFHTLTFPVLVAPLGNCGAHPPEFGPWEGRVITV